MSLARNVSLDNGSPFSAVLPSSQGTHERRKRKRRTFCVCTCFGLSLIAATATLIVVLGIRLTRGSYGGTMDMYPGATRLLRLSRTYCQGVIVSKNTTQANISLYSVNATPFPVVVNETVSTIQAAVLRPSEMRQWRFYVYKGMQLHVHVQTKTDGNKGSGVGFFEIHGSGNYTAWRRTSCLPRTSCHGVSYHRFNASISISQEENLYIVVQNNRTLGSVVLNMTFNIGLVTFSPSEHGQSSLRNCSTSSQTNSCSISIPMDSSHQTTQTALMTASIPPSHTWTEPIVVQWSCVPRVWVYVLVSLPATIFLFVAILALAIHCCLVQRRTGRSIPLPQLLGDASELDDELHGL